MEECLFDGKWPKRAPQSIHIIFISIWKLNQDTETIECIAEYFCTCFCGDKIFLLGFRTMILINTNDPTDFSIATVPCLTEFSSSSGMICF